MSTKEKKTRQQINHDYYVKHKDQHSEYMTKYFKDNRDKWNEYQRVKAKEYMKKKREPTKDTEDIKDVLIQNNHSSYC